MIEILNDLCFMCLTLVKVVCFLVVSLVLKCMLLLKACINGFRTDTIHSYTVSIRHLGIVII